MHLGAIAKRVQEGETVTFKAYGTSMTPRIRNGDLVTVAPTDECWIGDVVLARVNSRWVLHLVTGVSGRRVQISNNHGFVNGWTDMKNVVGVADR